jgi:hypothetical protein
MHEAKIEQTEAGRLPADDGWFILNLDEIGWRTIPGNGTWCVFESPEARSQTAKHGAAVSRPTDDACDAYEGRPPSEPARSPCPFRSPA